MTWRPLLAVSLLHAPVNVSQTEWLQGQTSSLRKNKKKSISGKMMRRVYWFVPQLKSVKRLGEKVSVDCQIITSQSTTYPLAALFFLIFGCQGQHASWRCFSQHSKLHKFIWNHVIWVKYHLAPALKHLLKVSLLRDDLTWVMSKSLAKPSPWPRG